MDNENMLIVCRSCGRKVLMHNMRPDSSGENMICIDCYKRSDGGKMSIQQAAKHGIENDPYQPTKAAAKPKTEKSEKMIKYICPDCKYKFSRKASQEVAKCPYCGKSNMVIDNQLGAEKLINDSANKKFETW